MVKLLVLLGALTILGTGRVGAVPARIMVESGRCGPNFGGTICTNNACCSRFDFCGFEDAWCGDGCQTGFGNCQVQTTPPPIIEAGRCGPNFDGIKCSDDRCCSAFDWCGFGDAWCGSGCQTGFGTCQNSVMREMDEIETSELRPGQYEQRAVMREMDEVETSELRPGQYEQKAVKEMNEVDFQPGQYEQKIFNRMGEMEQNAFNEKYETENAEFQPGQYEQKVASMQDETE